MLLEGEMNSSSSMLELGTYFFAWYALNVAYNITNKHLLNELDLPITVAFAQLVLGIPIFFPVWLMNPPPLMNNMKSWLDISKISLCHGFGNLATVFSLQSGSVAFTHVVKATEPLFSAILSAFFLKSLYATPVYICLIPIVVGVCLASAQEATFSWFGFGAAMASNFFYQCRMVLSKLELGRSDEYKIDVALSPSQLYRFITCVSSLQLFPIIMFFEGGRILPAISQALSRGVSSDTLLFNLLVSGFSYFMYNEVAFWILAKVTPVTHAVGNAVKRVVVVLASVVFLNSRIDLYGGIGAAIALLGTFLYSIATLHYKTGNSSR